MGKAGWEWGTASIHSALVHVCSVTGKFTGSLSLKFLLIARNFAKK